MLGFLGPNGAGKTTTMRAIFGLVEPDSGEVLWDGRPMQLQERLRFGYMPEERGLYPRMPVGEQVAYFGRLHGHGRDRGANRRSGAGWSGSVSLSARRRRWRSSRTETSSGRSSRRRWCTSRSCWCSTSRSRGSIRSPCRRSPRCCAARRSAAPPSSSPATSSSWSRTSARRSRSSTTAASSRPGKLDALRRRSQHRQIELQLDGAPPQWLPHVAGVELVERHNGDLRLLGRAGRRPRAGARRGRADGAGGRVQLRAAVALRAVPGAGGSDERPAGDHARCLARDPRAPAQPRLPRLDRADAAARRRVDGAERRALEEADLPRRGRRAGAARARRCAATRGEAVRREGAARTVASPAAGREQLDGEEGRRGRSAWRATGSSSAPTSTASSPRSRTRRCGRCATICRPRPSSPP